MPEDLVTVATFSTLPQAEAARLRLESEGFQVFLTDAELVNMDWLLGNAIGYIKLQTSAAQAEAAAQSVVKMRAEQAARAADEEDGTQEDDSVCLRCGVDLDEDAVVCPACGWSFAAGAETVE